MKIIRIILGIAFTISAISVVLTPLIGSYMQGYYKAQIDDKPELTEFLLEQKNFWVQISESKIFIIVCGVFLVLFLLSLLTLLFKKHDELHFQ